MPSFRLCGGFTAPVTRFAPFREQQHRNKPNHRIGCHTEGSLGSGAKLPTGVRWMTNTEQSSIASLPKEPPLCGLGLRGHLTLLCLRLYCKVLFLQSKSCCMPRKNAQIDNPHLFLCHNSATLTVAKPANSCQLTQNEKPTNR